VLLNGRSFAQNPGTPPSSTGIISVVSGPNRDNAAALAAVGVVAGTVLSVLVNSAGDGQSLRDLVSGFGGNPGTWFAVIVVTLILILVGAKEVDPRTRLSRKRALSPVEASYLAQLTRALDAQLTDVDPGPEEVVDLGATVSAPRSVDISPRYRVWAQAEGVTCRPGKSRTTRNITRFLRRSDAPIVLLGDPGSGKTVSLQRTARQLIHEGRRGRTDLLPVLLRLSEFTAPVVPDEDTHL